MGVPFGYFGGKSRLAKTLIAKFPAHTCYVEVFAGAAHVFFKKEPSTVEVINDLDKDLITLYRVIKHHPEELHRQFKFSLVSRDEFERRMREDPTTLTDVQRAARFLYLQKTCYGGKGHGRSFSSAASSASNLNLFTLWPLIEDAWVRMTRTTIECLDFRSLIPKYDRPSTLFFIDPPYWGIKGYAHNFVEQDFKDLSAMLATVKGRFLMTLNDTAEVRELFKDFSIEEVHLKYSMNSKNGAQSKIRTELLISN